ncbi:MAG: hypothetical protein KatS3mg095_0194 [Candidatus Parcubacteria bacterium]|nr:MAG: hypothetical protein KatS3mg095_0194 [Candidatus Parcubacteria bacterium]
MFKILPHTADIKFKVEAKNFLDLFRNSLNAINFYLKPRHKKKTKFFVLNINKDITPDNKTDILIDFLNEILSLTYIKKMIFKIKKIEIENGVLKITLIGNRYQGLEKEIKSITYHQAKLYEKNNNFIFEFIIDV